MRILITGGAGFIGANTASYYLQKKDHVTIYDDFSRDGVEKNAKWLKENFSNKFLKITRASVTDFKKLTAATKDIDVVFHFAGQTAVTTSIKDPRRDFQANALGTFNILESVRQASPKAIIVYSSTNKVYGAMSRVNTRPRGKRYFPIESPSIDESEQLDFYSPYGCSKGAGDQYVHDYHRIYGLNTIVFRQSCIYGTHQLGVEDQGWLAHFTAQVVRGKPLTIFGDGKQVRDILYITDLVDAYDKAVKNIDVTKGQVYNIGGGIRNSASLLEVIEILARLSGTKIKFKFQEERLGDQKVYISNIDKAYRDFDWQPKIGIHQGLELLYSWLKESLI